MPEWRRRLWAETLRDLSALGSFQILCLVGLGLCLFDFRLAGRVLSGLCLVELAATILKLVVFRSRPDGQRFTNLIERIDAGSLPSAHAARCLFVGLTLSGWCASLAQVALPACLLVGLSRVLLRRHRASDVAAGYFLGAAVSLLVSRG